MPTGSYVDSCQVSEYVALLSRHIPCYMLIRTSRSSDFTISPEGRAVGAEIWDEMKQIWKEKVNVDADALLARA
jgi:hypothetical protein